jgi:ribosomal-protein-alanine N-acetyltransferase
MPLTILLHQRHPAAFLPYNPRFADVAARLGNEIREVEPILRVEHVGSSAVPGCGGKGILDLLVMYPPNGLEAAKRALATLGYQHQPHRNPFPEDRPMRVGRVEYDGAEFNIHAHVVAEDSVEAADLIRFRDRLRSDPALRAAYEAEKKRILVAGVLDSTDYSEIKGAFVQRELQATRSPDTPAFHFLPMQTGWAAQIAVWRYPGEYAFYNMAADPEDAAEILNPAIWPGRFFAGLTGQKELAGFFEYERQGDALVIGLGLRPDLTGRGIGLVFIRSGLDFGRGLYRPKSFRLRVATFNRRAIKVYKRAGFKPEGIEWFTLNGKAWEFLWMNRME